jgi:Tfp pilus assembly protein PilZ
MRTLVDRPFRAVLRSRREGNFPEIADRFTKMTKAASPEPQDKAPSESVLRKLRIPFVRRATLKFPDHEEDVFTIDVGLEGVFVERRDPLRIGQELEIRFAFPESEIPMVARCRVAWWHKEDAPLSSKSLPAGAGLEFVEMSEHDRTRMRDQLLAYCRQQPSVRRFLRHWPQAEREGDDP